MDDEFLSFADVYALDAVDPEERAHIERRLEAADEATRAEFRARVAEVRQSLAELSVADAVDPPESLRSRVLAVPGEMSAPHRDSRAPDDDGPTTARRRHAGTVTPLRPRRRALTVIAGVAAAVLIAAGGIGIGYGIARSNQPQPSDLQAEVLDAPDATLNTAELPGGGTTTMVTSEDENAAVVLLHKVGAPPKGKVYQMWLMDAQGKNPRSVAIMNRGDVKPTTTALIKGVKDAGAFAITVEPDGGSKQPTTKPFSLISLGSS
ncbi:anti-sigma factor [Spelaeicoccus albus]|uniref:Regulator of SigK n=1 Tax=Spelaeicoccus albus TaxID=1280376 RepID=A0A7Z0AAT6_9MICO|nr:anti-sigma factor [Spelaeicoccus albus]NYI66485.1 anti-sigma-K factor RskA [Spelaeicoccus albus]